MSSQRNKKTSKRRSLGLRRHSMRMALETRVMFDGAGVVTAVDTVDADPATLVPSSVNDTTAVPPQNETQPTSEGAPTQPTEPVVDDAEPTVPQDIPQTSATTTDPANPSEDQSNESSHETPVDDVTQDEVTANDGEPRIDIPQQDQSADDVPVGHEIVSSSAEGPADGASPAGSDTEAESDPATELASVDESTREVVFINDQVEDADTLIADLKSHHDKEFEVYVLDSTQDGLAQVNSILNGGDAVDAIHFVTHGDDARIQIGQTWIDSTSVENQQAEFQALGQHLTDSADILFYGCSITESEDGVALITRISALTDADVAASTDATGTELRAGDWQLESTIGIVDTTIAFSAPLQQTWSGLLATLNVDAILDYNSTDGRYGDTSSVTALLANKGSDGQINLREAITAANNTAGSDYITFDFAGVGPHTINLISALPVVSDAIFVDGWSQNGFVSSPVVTLNGTGALNGLVLSGSADGSTIRGLAIINVNAAGIIVLSDSTEIQGNYIGVETDGVTTAANGKGILFSGNTSNVLIGTDSDGVGDVIERNIIGGNIESGIELGASSHANIEIAGNYIGIGADGTTAVGNGGDGIVIQGTSTDVSVGGGSVTDRNVISGNTGSGIVIRGENADGNTIQNNFIGTGADGVHALGNGGDGVRVELGADQTTIVDNVIAGNGLVGINVDGDSANTIIGGNHIGTDLSDTVQMGQGGSGIHLQNGANNTFIGGVGVGQSNTIANNGSVGVDSAGVRIDTTAGTENTVRYNNIINNNGLTIDLNAHGPDVNDPGDGDLGGNNGQNSPVLDSVTIYAGDSAHFLGDASGLIPGAYTLDFYASNTAGEHWQGIGQVEVSSQSTATAGTLSYVVNGLGLTPGSYVTVTATDSLGNTSELSNAVVVITSTGDAPYDLEITESQSGGLEMNNDGGNSIYLEVENGGDILGGQDALTIEAQFQSTSEPPVGEARWLVGYNSPNNSDALHFAFTNDSGTTELKFAVNDQWVSTSNFDSSTVFNGKTHHVAVTWNNVQGAWTLYFDGQAIESGTGLSAAQTVESTGSMVIGIDNDSGNNSNTLSPTSSFQGVLNDVRVFDHARAGYLIEMSALSDIPDNEPGLVANWQFDSNANTGNLVEEVNGNNLTIRSGNGTGWIASETELTLEVNESQNNGDVIGSVSGYDIQHQAEIGELLTTNPNLHYNAETGKFYQYISTAQSHDDAHITATTSQLNGVSGKLVVPESGHENAYLSNLVYDTYAQSSSWLGVTDALTEGDWQQLDAAGYDDPIWENGSNGNRVDGAFSNWNPGQPDDFNDQDYAVLKNTGLWDDESQTSLQPFVIEYDAASVLNSAQALTYSIASQTAVGAFTIDSTSGEIRIADTNAIDFETQSFIDIDIAVSDGSGSHTETFRVQLNDVVEINDGPTGVVSGIELNADGGNDAYLVDNTSGIPYLNNLSEFTMEFGFSELAAGQDHTLFVHNDGAGMHNHLVVQADGTVKVAIDSSDYSSTNQYSELVDGDRHAVAIAVDGYTDSIRLFVDGEHVETMSTSAFLSTNGGGSFVIGQHPSSGEFGFRAAETFQGTLHDVRIWDNLRTTDEIGSAWQHALDISPTEANQQGLVAHWQMNQLISDTVTDQVGGYTLSVTHVTGAGFVSSTPVDQLNVDEAALSDTSVGFVVPQDGTLTDNIVSDPLFVNSGITGFANLPAGSAFGDWTIDAGSIALEAGWADTSPLGGHPINLDGTAPGAISQILTTEPGKEYQVTFALTGNFQSGNEYAELRVSADGLAQDFSADKPAGWSTSSLMWEQQTFTFVADNTTTKLSFASLSDSGGTTGAIIGDIQVFEIPEAVQTILNDDATLSYNAATGKFYRIETAGLSWSDAQLDATSAANAINGVNGQLVVISSDAENEYLHDLVRESGVNKVWIGASDATVDGEWRWQDQTADGTQFANATGQSVNGAFTNFGQYEPNGATGENAAELISLDGTWNDLGGILSQSYVIEWDASQILSHYSYAMTDPSGNFVIDAVSGEIKTTAGNTLDFETATFHDVDVTVTDSAGNTTIDTVRIYVNDTPEGDGPVNSLPLTQTVNEGDVLTFSAANGNAITVSDQTVDDTPLQVTINVPPNTGVLTLSGTSGITIPGGVDGSRHMVIEGTESDINAALDGLTFTPDQDFYGNVTLNIVTQLSANLEGFYAFENTSDPGQDTSTGQLQSGTAMGGVATGVDATRGNVLQLDGTDDAIVINSTFNNSQSVTLGGWVNLTGSGRNEFISIDDRVHLALDDGALGVKGSFQSTENPGTWNDLTSGVLVSGTGWRHVAYTFDDGLDTHSLYIDGVLVASEVTTDTIDYSGATTTYIGQHPTVGNHLGGALDDVQIYERALSASEIASIANDNFEDTDIVTIVVNPINDDPTISLGGGPVTYTENATPVFIDDNNAFVNDIDSPDFDGGSLTVSLLSGGSSDDVLAIDNDGTGAGEIGVSGNTVTYGGVAIGTFSGGTGGTDLTINLNANANSLATEALTRHVVFSVNSEDPSETTRNVRATLTDGDGGSAFGANLVEVVKVNDAPVLDASFDLTLDNVLEDATNPGWTTVATMLNSDASNYPISDPDSSALDGIAVVGVDNTNGTWQYAIGVGWTDFGPVSDSTATLLATTAAIRFIPNADYSGSAGTITIRAWDRTAGISGQTGVDTTVAGGTSAYSATTDTATLDVIADNDEQLIVTSTTITVAEGGTGILTNNELLTTDADNTSNQLIYTLTNPPINGQLELTSTPGTQVTSFTQQQIDNGNVVYVHDGSETNSDSFNFQVDDGQGTQSTGIFGINVTPTNDIAPMISDQSAIIAEDTGNTTVVYQFNDDTTGTDNDGDGETITYQITGGNAQGVFSINPATGEVIVADNTNLDYETSTQHVLAIQASDGTLTDTASLTIDVTNVNDNPAAMISQTVSLSESATTGTSVVDINDTNTGNDTDIDGDTLTYSILSGDPGGLFALNAVTGEITVANGPALDYETTPQHVLLVQASDGLRTTGFAITVNLTNENDRAPDIVDDTVLINENAANGTSIVDVNNITTGTDSDADGDAITYAIVGGNTSGAYTINAATGEIAVANGALLDYETTPQYTLTVEATDGLNTDSATITVDLANLNDNTPSVSDQTVTIAEDTSNTTVVYQFDDDTTAADNDSDGDAITYQITGGNAQGIFSVNASTGEVTVADNSNLDYETNNQHLLSIQASDGVLTDTASLTIDVTNVNDSQPAIVSQTVTLSETASTGTSVVDINDASGNDTDVDGDALTYNIVSGDPAGVFAINAATGEIAVANGTALDYETTPQYMLVVEASDGTYTDNGTVTVTIQNQNDNLPSIVDQTVNIDENSANGTAVVDIDDANSGNDTDLDGEALTYSIVGGNTTGAYTINATTGEIAVSNGALLDYETTPQYTLTVEATDGLNTDSATITVDLANLNDNAPVISDRSIVLPEHAAVGTQVVNINDNNTGSDSDTDGNTLTFNIVGGDPGGVFTIDNATGEIVVADSVALDFETTPQFNLTVEASDGVNSDTATIVVDLTNQNDNAPIVIDQTVSVTENAANGVMVVDLNDNSTANDTDRDGEALSYSIVSGDPGGAFMIDAQTGQITVANGSTLDYETVPQYTLGVEVSDGTNVDTATINVDLINQNDNLPVIGNSVATVVDNANNGTFVININEDSTGDDTDADGDPLNYSIVGGDPSGTFTINAATGEIIVNNGALIDFDTAPQITLTVEASDGVNTDQGIVTINVDNVNNLAPVIDDLVLALTENTPAGTLVADINDALTGIDADVESQTLTYTLTGGNGDAIFAIDAGTGALTVNDAALLDFEADQQHVLTVQASDGVLTDVATFTVDVIDANEAPVATLVPVLSQLPDNTSTAGAIKVADITVTDDALGNATLVVSGPNSALFEIQGQSLYLKPGVDLSVLGGNVLNVAVDAFDSTIAGAAPLTTPGMFVTIVATDTAGPGAPPEPSEPPVTAPEEPGGTGPIDDAPVAEPMIERQFDSNESAMGDDDAREELDEHEASEQMTVALADASAEQSTPVEFAGTPNTTDAIEPYSVEKRMDPTRITGPNHYQLYDETIEIDLTSIEIEPVTLEQKMLSVITKPTVFNPVTFSAEFYRTLEAVAEQLQTNDELTQEIKLVVGSISFTVSLGYLLWLVKSFGVLSGVLSARSIALNFDTLYILKYSKRKNGAGTKNEDEVNALFTAGQ